MNFENQIKAIESISDEEIRKQANFAAEHDLGSHGNPFPEETRQYKIWTRAYYARQHELAMECVQ